MKARTDYAYIADRVGSDDFSVTHTPSGRQYVYRPAGRVFSVRAGRYLGRDTSTGRACRAAVDRLLAEEGTAHD